MDGDNPVDRGGLKPPRLAPPGRPVSMRRRQAARRCSLRPDERTTMTLSADDEIEALRAQLAQVNDPSVTPPVSEARSGQAAYGTAVPLPAGIEGTSVTLGGVPTERLHPSGTQQQRAFLLLHSGGYSAGTAADHAALAAQLALSADATGYVPEYRRAPEYPFPAAVDEAMHADRGLVQA